MKLTVCAIAITYEDGSFGNSKRKNKVRIEKPQMAGRGLRQKLLVLDQFQLSRNPGALK
jgi:hypothetical protein